MYFNQISWQETIKLVSLILYGISLLAVMALPIMSVAGQTLSLIHQRTAYAKCSKQITCCAVFLSWLLTIISTYLLGCELAPYTFKLTNFNDCSFFITTLFESIKKNIQIEVQIYSYILLLIATLCLTLFYSLWKKWKEYRITIQCLAILSSCWFTLAMFIQICIKSLDSLHSLGIPYPTSLNSFLMPSLETSFWNVAPYIIPLSFAIAGGMSCVWLIIKRNHDDFGRDYYNQMLPWCASWARTAWLIFWLILVITTTIRWYTLLQQENFLKNLEFIHSIMFLILWLIPGILWSILISSKQPLRHKIIFIVTFILSIIVIIPIFNTL